MQRRQLIKFGAVIAAAAMVPANLSAVNFRETKPKAWTAKTTNNAIKELFGTSSTIEGKVKLKAPDIAENGGVIPITVSTKLKAKTIAIFQDVNPQSAVAVFDVPENGFPEYSIRIRMMSTGKVTVVADVDGKLYSTSKTVKVTIGGCGG
jgi:sulfur-oxidizing protein SoxY